MQNLTQHIGLSKTTSSSSAEDVIDTTGSQPIRWFTIVVDYDCYIGINGDAATPTGSNNTFRLNADETYTTPRDVWVWKISIMRVSSNVTLRGSAFY